MAGMQREAQSVWRKSSYSSESANCVEVALLSRSVAVRDSKDADGPVLLYDIASWRAFIAAVQVENGFGD